MIFLYHENVCVFSFKVDSVTWMCIDVRANPTILSKHQSNFMCVLARLLVLGIGSQGVLPLSPFYVLF